MLALLGAEAERAYGGLGMFQCGHALSEKEGGGRSPPSVYCDVNAVSEPV